MPIPQSRLISLLEAALDYKHAFTEIARLIAELSHEIDNSRLRALARYTANDFLADPIKTNTTIALEEERISHTRRYNETRRAKASLAKQEIPSMQTPEDLENELIAKQAGFPTFAAYQAFLFEEEENK